MKLLLSAAAVRQWGPSTDAGDIHATHLAAESATIRTLKDWTNKTRLHFLLHDKVR